jgi:hypothetical protein
MSDKEDLIITKLIDIEHGLGKVEGEIKSFHQKFVDHAEEDKVIGQRLNKVERKQSWILGVSAGAAGAVAAAWEMIRYLKPFA